MDTNIPSGFDDRAWQRRPVIKLACLTLADGEKIDCAVLDISAQGVRLAYSAPANIPDVVMVTLRGGKPVIGRVRWRSADGLGLEIVG